MVEVSSSGNRQSARGGPEQEVDELGAIKVVAVGGARD
jgi:hypothetical protein